MADGPGVDMRPVKALFNQMLPPGDALREAVNLEENWLPVQEGLAKLAVYYRIWTERQRQERGGHG